MKVIRCNVFETNSSSTHSICICTEDEFRKFKDEELMFDNDNNNFVTMKEAIESLKKKEMQVTEADLNSPLAMEAIKEKLQDYSYCTWENYGNYNEVYSKHFTTPSGDKMVAFGYYGDE